MSAKWSDLVRELNKDPEYRKHVEAERDRILRRYNRPWWRLVRLWDKLRHK